MAINFPSSPIEGQVHNVSPGKSFVYRSGAWAQAPMKTALPKNYVVNPAMTVSQQNGDVASTGATFNGYFPADQFGVYTTWPAGAGMITRRNAGVTPQAHALFKSLAAVLHWLQLIMLVTCIKLKVSGWLISNGVRLRLLTLF